MRASCRLFFALCAVILTFALFAGFANPAHAEDPITVKEVPDALKPWVPWVLHGKEESACPIIQDGAPSCTWPTRLELSLGEKGGTFKQDWRVDAKGFVPLPGDERRWPQDVRAGGKKTVVVNRNGKPHVELAPGVVRLEGTFAWDVLPESLPVPNETGLLELTVRGVRIAQPVRDAQGAVFLQKDSVAQEGDALEIVVHRRIEDDAPMRLTTRIQIAVAGKNREVILGRALPAGFVPVLLESPLPTRVEPDSRLRVQARAGTYVIELTARSDGAVTTLERPQPDGPWREGDEVWVFQARPELRVAEIEGVASIDPAQTTLPDAWKKLPAYPMKLGAKMRIVEKRRGDADPPPDQLTLQRRMWLDFDGNGFTISDRLTGTLSRSTRLEMLRPTVLGRVAVKSKDQFITHLGDQNKLGVEIRQGDLDVVADSRYVGSVTRLPAVGWNHDFSRVSATLHVPPGFRVLHASGVDEVPGTWIRHFTLLEIFLVLVLALATARLYGMGWGAVALVTLVLIVPESGAPRWIWAVLLAFEALVRVLPQGVVKKIAGAGRFAVAMLLVLITIPFLVEHVRHGLYPQLATSGNGGGGVVGGFGERAMDEESRAVAPATPPVEATVPQGQTTPEPLTNKNEDRPADNKQLEKADVAGKKKPAPNRAFNPGASASSEGSWKSGYGGTGAREQSQLNVDVYDPNAVVQTGPGLPSWTWSTIELRWSGPVERTQELRLWLVGPTFNFILALLRAALVVAFAARMMPFFDWIARRPRGGVPPAAAVAASIAFAFFALTSRAAFAQATPDNAVLEELQKRLVQAPSCAPQCASINRLALDIGPASLRGRLAIDTGAKIAVPLPGGASQWLPERVSVDGKPATGLVLKEGKLYVVLDPGSHDVLIEGALPARETVQVPLPFKPHRVEADTKGWKLDGLHEDGLADDSLQLTRIATNAAGGASSMETSALPPFVRVERTLRLGLSWQVETRIVRVSPLGAAIVLEVPLLPGESVTTADVRVADHKVLVNLGAQAQDTTWKSVLETKSPIKLTAPKGLPWVETWRLDLSPIWHASFGGIPPVHPGPKRFASMPEWRPWPGESVTLDIARPEGAAGQTLTVDESKLEVRPGLRSTDATLTLRLRASRGGQHVITLPPGAVLESFKIGGTAQPIRQEGSNVAVPVTPGAQDLQLGWREPRGVSFKFEVAPVDLHIQTVNANVNVGLGDARWVLWAWGPRLGPAVLFWSLLLVLLVVAAALSRVRFVPLTLGAWLLLAVGLSQIPIVAAAIVVAWLVALGARKRWPELSPGWFDVRQVALAMLTLAAMGVLVVAVHQGLLGRPDMQIEGNGSSAGSLQWFDDRADAKLPQPWVLSVPMLVYRLAMLAWALWLALAILKWLRFGWSAFTEGGLWRDLPKPVRRAPVPTPQQQAAWAAQQHWQEQQRQQDPQAQQPQQQQQQQQQVTPPVAPPPRGDGGDGSQGDG